MLYRSTLVLFCVFASCARAEMVSVALPGGSVDLPIPQGYCVLTKASPDERALIELQERMQSGMNRVLVYAAPCPLIGGLRAGGMLSEYAVWLGTYSNGGFRRISPTHSLVTFLDETARAYPRYDAEAVSREMVRRRESGQPDLSAQYIGIIDRDDNGVYLGRAGNVGAPGAAPVTVVGVTAITLAERYPVSFSVYHEMSGSETLDRLHNVAQEIARRHIAYASGNSGLQSVAVNLDDTSGGGWFGSGLVIAFALLGGAFGVGVVVLLSRRVG